MKKVLAVMSLFLMFAVKSHALNLNCSGPNCSGVDQVAFTTNTIIQVQGVGFTADGTTITSANGLGGGGGGAALVLRMGNTFTTISTAIASGNLDLQVISGTGVFKVDLSTLNTQVSNLNSATTSLTNAIVLLGTETVSGGGGGVKSFFLRTAFDTSNASNYFLMFSTPSPNVEATKTASVASANGLVMLSSHSTLAGGLGQGVNVLPAGFWQFVMFAGIDSIVNQTDLVIDIATMSRTGTGLRNVVSSTITNVNTLTPSLYVAESVLTTDVSISTDDRLVVNIYAKTTSVIARTVTLALEGTARASRIGTTIERQPTFLSLNDAPATYIGQSGKVVSVNTTESGLVFTAAGASVETDPSFILAQGTIASQLNGLIAGASYYVKNSSTATNAVFNVSSGTVISTLTVIGGEILGGPLTMTGVGAVPTIYGNSTNGQINMDAANNGTPVASFMASSALITGLVINDYDRFTTPAFGSGTFTTYIASPTMGIASSTLGSFQYNNAISSQANFCVYPWIIPPDIDLRSPIILSSFAIMLGGADTNGQVYVVSLSTNQASSNLSETKFSGSGAWTSSNTVVIAGDANGANGDLENSTGAIVMGGWPTSVIPGTINYIIVSRDGDHGSDTSTVNSYSAFLTLKYKRRLTND